VAASDADEGRRALIIGGSMAGLFTALLLRKQGWRVDVFERSAEKLSSRGAGIATHEPLIAALRAAGVDPGAALGVPIKGRTVFDRHGRILETYDLPQVMTSWDLLFRLLRAALPDDAYNVGVPLDSFSQSGNKVTAHFAGGRTERGDLLIAADGVLSTVRTKLLPTVEPRYAGYVAWRGMANESDIAPSILDSLDERMGFCLPSGEHCLTYPVAGPNEELTRGQRRRNWVWYRSAVSDAEQAALMTTADGRRQGVSVPPHKVRAEAVAAMRRDARELLAPQIFELVQNIEEPFLQAIIDLESPQVAFDRVAVLGDAAFVARPHTGMGVTKAAEDAVALAQSLVAAGDDVNAGLIAWEQQCLAYGRVAVARGRKLGELVYSDRTRADGDVFGLDRGVNMAVMVETAVPGDILA
jgi:2-polyprenyl-6-methoxyphenol hydroxylase-like FAD-dependent oxidoreductase